MNAAYEIFSSSFLLRDALYSSIVIGLLCPLIGVFLVLKRKIFLGVALPQVSGAGISFAFLTYNLLFQNHEHGGGSEQLLASVGSICFTLITLFIFVILENRSTENSESRVGAIFAIASALTILFLAADPNSEAQMIHILRGDMLAATQESFVILSLLFLLVALFIFKFQRQLILVACDRDLAKVFRMRVESWDFALYLCVGLVIAVGVMRAGPMLIFGFLILPVIAARGFCKHVSSLLIVSSLIGGGSAFIGFCLSYTLDFPLGATQVALCSVVLITICLLRKLNFQS